MEKKKTKNAKAARNNPRLEGAEAILMPISFGPFSALDKIRQPKAYRPKSLDDKIRSSRTRVEARLLARAKKAGVPCPQVLSVGPFDIVMGKVGGKTLNRCEPADVHPAAFTLAGLYLARLHAAGVVHGDYTPANLMLDGKKKALFVIDFGLGSVSSDVEDFAVDVLTMKKALKDKKMQEAFLSGYKREGNARVLKHMAEVEKRARYQDRGG